MAAVRGLVEVVLLVNDMERSLAFYRDALGLELFSPPELPGKFLRIGDRDGVPAQIVLVPRRGDDAAPAEKAQRNLHHLGLEVAPEAFEGERARLAALGYELRPGTHPFLDVEAFYLDDPDGNEVEIVTRPA